MKKKMFEFVKWDTNTMEENWKEIKLFVHRLFEIRYSHRRVHDPSIQIVYVIALWYNIYPDDTKEFQSIIPDIIQIYNRVSKTNKTIVWWLRGMWCWLPDSFSIVLMAMDESFVCKQLLPFVQCWDCWVKQFGMEFRRDQLHLLKISTRVERSMGRRD